MNKFFTKIAAAFVGMAMAIGVGVAIDRKGAVTANADQGDSLYSQTFNNSTFYNSYAGVQSETSGKIAQSYFKNQYFTKDTIKWTFSSANCQKSNTTYTLQMGVSTTASKVPFGVLAGGETNNPNNGTTIWDDLIDAFCEEDDIYSESKTTAHAYAMITTDLSLETVGSITFSFGGGKAGVKFLTYLFADTGSGLVCLKSDSYTPANASESGSIVYSNNNAGGISFSKLAFVFRPTGDDDVVVTSGGNYIKLNSISILEGAPASAQTYTVHFNNNGGSGSMSDVTDATSPYTLPSSTFGAPDGKAFVGWKKGNVGDLIAAGATCAIDGETTFYAQWNPIRTITTNVTNGSYTGDSSIIEGGNASVRISSNSGYKLPASVTVSGATSSYDSGTGVISLSNPTTNVTITATCPALDNYTITVNASHCTYSGASSIQEKGKATVTFVADEDYFLPSVSDITVSGATKESFTNGALVIKNPSGNVTITIAALKYDNTFNIVSGGQYKIYHTISDVKYYMVANGGASRPTSTTNPWEATIFTFTLVGDDSISIKNGNNYIYNTNSNDGVKSGTTSDTSWILTSGTHYDKTQQGSRANDGDGYYNLCSNNNSRYLAFYETNDDFRSYTSDIGTNRTSSTQFELYNAVTYAQDVISATKTVCDEGYNNTKGSFTTKDASDKSIWDYLTTNYSSLNSSDKTLLINATYTRDGSTVTATGGTNQTIAEGVARHDYLVAKYGLDNILAGRDIPALSRIDLGIASNDFGNNSASLVIVIISLTSIAAIGGFFFLRKRKEER